METTSPMVPRKRAGTAAYVAVFLVLAVITAVEVGLTFAQFTRDMKIPLLLGLSFAKASLVAAFYMHLRKDSRLYTYVFLVPVPLVLLFAVLMVIA
jgi:cytochrome c oxidase subunit 4